MARCIRNSELEVHHIRQDGGNDIANAQVLCQLCHEETSTYGEPGQSPLDFDEDTKAKALRRAGNRCECSRDGCH